MANPPGNQPEANHAFNGTHSNNGNLIPETSAASVLKHNPGNSVDWTLEEQAKLEDGLTELPVDLEPIIRYAKIAMRLPNKTVRDVAMRCRWMTKKENNRRRKEERSRKNKDKRERFVGPSGNPTLFAAQPNPPPDPIPMIPMDYNDGFPCRDIGGGLTGELLQQNAQALDQISANLANFQVQDNIALLSQTRDNILKLMNALDDVPLPDKMKQMPPLPVTINHELANAILPPPSHNMHSSRDPPSDSLSFLT